MIVFCLIYVHIYYYYFRVIGLCYYTIAYEYVMYSKKEKRDLSPYNEDHIIRMPCFIQNSTQYPPLFYL